MRRLSVFLSPFRLVAALALAAGLAGCASTPGAEAQRPVRVKVFVAAMFEIGQNTGDRAAEFQHWYER